MQKIKIASGEFWTSDPRLELIPVIKRKLLPWWYRVWIRVAPEAWRRHRRHKAHLAFLDKCGVTDKDFRRRFGCPGYIFMEKVRMKQERLRPEDDFNDFDARMRPPVERRANIRATINQSIDEVRTSLNPSQ